MLIQSGYNYNCALLIMCNVENMYKLFPVNIIHNEKLDYRNDITLFVQFIKMSIIMYTIE